MQFASHAGAWGGGPACPPPVTGSNTRVFTRQAVISLHTDPVRAAESPTHPTCPGLPSDFCLSCCSFQNSIIKSGIKMSPILRPNYGLFLCSCHELRGACWRAGGGGGLLQEQAGTVVFPAEATGGPSVLHSGLLIWVTFREQVPWISSHENEAPAPTEAQARRGAGAAWTASSQPRGGSQELQGKTPTTVIPCETRGPETGQGASQVVPQTLRLLH